MDTIKKGPSEEDVELARAYLEEFNKYDPNTSEPICEEFLRDTTLMWIGVVKKLGNGDIKLAAKKHAKALIAFYENATEEEKLEFRNIIRGESQNFASVYTLINKVFDRAEA